MSKMDMRHARLFRAGPDQAVRIPKGFELPGDEVIIHREGDRLVIEPVARPGLLALLATLEPIDEAFPDVDEGLRARDTNLRVSCQGAGLMVENRLD
ncbi:antitoxin [Tistrella mobilis]|uniref:Virulence-associated protein VapB-like protein n=1 Tax=Tistrella mobilis (strain KA081020-065) TaxID=1110502 RepID=I3TI13_TISMK|nr:virulence-associated protein VapB-like protein [Tistrella mobilis KA081020-065]